MAYSVAWMVKQSAVYLDVKAGELHRKLGRYPAADGASLHARLLSGYEKNNAVRRRNSAKPHREWVLHWWFVTFFRGLQKPPRKKTMNGRTLDAKSSSRPHNPRCLTNIKRDFLRFANPTQNPYEPMNL